MTGTYQATRVLVEGTARGSVMKLNEPLSFWGGFDPETGTILDVRHERCGDCVAERMLLFPGSRGSGGTPAGIAEAIRLGVGPAAFLILESDVNLMVGMLVANTLYDTQCPVLVLSLEDYTALSEGDVVAVSPNGLVSIVDPT